MYPITGKERKTAWGQHLSQGVNHRMGHVLGAGTQLQDGKHLGARIDDQPQPENLCGAAQPDSQFVQLQMRHMQVAEAALVQGLRLFASTCQKGC
jgi:hypothetical protein